MKLVKLNIAATILLLLFKAAAYGQVSGRVTGCVKDSLTHENVAYATVALTDQRTKATVKATQTDINGNFVLESLPPGTFTLRISYVGYQDIFKADVTASPTTGNLNLGDLLMNTSKSNSLKEVVVTSKKDALQNIDGKKVFSVNQSLVSKGGNAADLLQNVPTLQIDGNGNVSLRGSAGVKVLIDGKPSVIADGDVSQILQSIPASVIETIEVIPNPSAKYDANGEGIINIILKKNSRPGLNGSVNLGGGTRDNYNGSANLSYQSGKVNLYGNYSIKNGNTYSNGFQYMTFLKPTDSIRYSNETFPSVTRNKIQFLKGGIDYLLTPKSTIGISGSLNTRNTHRDEVLSIDNLALNGAPLQSSNRYNTTNNNGNSYELDLDYDQHFKKPKEELTFNFSFAYGSFRNWQEYETHQYAINGQPAPPIDTPLISDIRNKATNYNVQADYVLPVGKAGQFSAGYRSQITLGNNNQYAYSVTGTATAPVYAFTSFFSSNNQVHAVYVNYQDKIADFGYQIGLRAEDSHLNATFMSYDANNALFAEPVKVPSVGLYPSVLLTEKLENNSELQFTFTNRVSRPTARELNSATDFSDPVNYERGNPGLTPESINSLELGYNKTWQNISFTSGLYYNRINNVIKHIESDPVDGIVITTAQNLKRSTTTGLELIGHFDVVKGWDFIANANIYERDNDAAPQFGITQNTSLSWNANVTNNITLLEKLSFQIRADYRAPDMIVQDKNRAAFGMDAAAKYDFPGNRASLSFNANDIFNSRKWAFLRSSDDLLLDFERRTVSSRATLTFTYRFGSSPGSSKQPRKKEAQRDKRIDDAS
ncbi:outer membrane receptor protein involved in Fe transport [Mucilaginibacter frigoritolerans]|uniref:Outer membrane receptor protein involved in Fe transport n=1 Tax=Mucilaginibacter frigoritolerans TaxID=652788 RepID=A0A562TZI7_9SPHI|nr:outer membrane beta-barrel family protein [Mucilaginibacter frigoritolerans]TWI98648.1 outer membrane receptor protein involved in Fe transport [Mucilaginibacter frigoritolerans]